jgi:hypothetical protein
VTRPGDRLRAFAAGWCCPETMERVIDPLIADLQREHGEAVRRGLMWRSRWIQIAGWFAFLKVIVFCTWAGGSRGADGRLTSDGCSSEHSCSLPC